MGWVGFRFSGINFTAPESVHYRYRLNNYDSKWINAGSQGSAAYTQVPPGTYEFEVQAANSNGKFNPASASLAFEIQPTVYQTWWFQTSAALLGGIVIIALTYAPINRRRQMERLRLRLARDLHDEVGSNLGSISLYSQLAEEKTGKNSPASEEFEEINRTVQQTVQSLRDVIWFTNPKFDTLRGMLQQMKDTANRMLSDKQLTFEAKCASLDGKLSLNFRRHLFLIFREMMHNILKHSRADRVEVSLIQNRGRMLLTTTDNGIGFETRQSRKGNGLTNIEQRTKELRGTLSVKSHPGNGTSLSVEVPIT